MAPTGGLIAAAISAAHTPTSQGGLSVARDNKGDKRPDLELNLLAEGLAAIQEGDVAGGTDALRYLKDMQDARDARQERDKK